MTTDLATIEAALAAATPGPWENATPPEDSTETVAQYMATTCQRPDAHASHLWTTWAPDDPREGTIIIAYTGDGPTSRENGNLIANAPAWLAELVERVKAGAEDVRAFSEALGFGDGRTEPAASLEELVDPLQWAMSAAKDHNECPAVCERCGERLASAVCEKCHGSGCLPNPEMAYLECDECAGVGKVHVGCAEASYAELVERVKVAEAEVERLSALDHETAGEAMMAAELRSQGRRRAVAEATIARVRELAESVPKTIARNPSDAAYLSGQVDFAESVLDALNHTDGISPWPVLIDEVHRFTSVNSAGADDTTLRARAEDATEPILRPADQRSWDRPEVALIRHMGGRTYARVGAHKWTELPKFGQVLVTEDLVAQQHEAIAVFIRPTDQRYEPPAVDDESGCCRG